MAATSRYAFRTRAGDLDRPGLVPIHDHIPAPYGPEPNGKMGQVTPPMPDLGMLRQEREAIVDFGDELARSRLVVASM